MTKIVVFTTAYRPFIGGSEIALEEIVKRLPEFFFEIITPLSDGNLSKEETGVNYRINRVGLGFKIDKFLFPVLGFLKAKKLKHKGIIHGYQASHGSGAAYLFKLFNPTLPFVITMQEGKRLETQGFLINYFRGVIIRKADRATAISQYLARYISSVKRDLPIDLIPNGADIDNFSRDFSYGDMTALDKKLGIKADEKVIVSASRLVEKNGIDLLIRALALLNGSSADSHKLLLVGDGPLKEEFQTLAENLGMGANVIFVGSISHSELPLYLKISDVFVRPSRSEGLGSAFLEAMVAGVPVIGTRIGGIPDFLEDRKTGLFCSFDPEDIAFKIRIILENEKLRQFIVNNASELVRKKYDWNEIANKFRHLYRGLSTKH